MKAYFSALRFGIKQISRDYMLALMVGAPFLCGVVFKFIIPLVDGMISNKYGTTTLIQPYYNILDNTLLYLTPSFICIISSLLMLEERDEGITSYLFVTPVGYSGYILGRLVIPAIVGFLVAIVVGWLFKLTDMSFLNISILALISTLYAIASTLVVVSKANNKVEGFALVKLTGMSFIGVLAPYLIKGAPQYAFSILPSFWIAKISLEYGEKLYIVSIMLGILCCICWIVVLYRVFRKRIT